MISITGQNELFKLIGTKLDEKAECMAIGGTAMMFYGAKTETKDIDLVFLDKKSFNLTKNALQDLGFTEKKRISNIFAHYDYAANKPVMMEGRDTRFDLFLNEVICFKISQSIIERIREVHEFGSLIVKLASPEDIILLKCATERQKDRDDAVSLIKKFNIDWDIVLNESITQTNIGGDVFPVFLFDFLYDLKEDFKVDIPKEVMSKIRKIGEKIMLQQIKSGSSITTTKFKP